MQNVSKLNAGIRFTRSKNAGFTLLELLIVLAIVSILAPLFGRFMVTVAKAQAAAAKLNASPAPQRDGQVSQPLRWTSQTISAGVPILCFTGNATYSCLPSACSFQDGTWSDGSHRCSGGILYSVTALN